MPYFLCSSSTVLARVPDRSVARIHKPVKRARKRARNGRRDRRCESTVDSLRSVNTTSSTNDLQQIAAELTALEMWVTLSKLAKDSAL